MISPLRKFFGTSLFLGTLALTSCGPAPKTEPQAPVNDPAATEGNAPGEAAPPPAPGPTFRGQDLVGEKNFAYLINNHLVGKVEPNPWAGAWWPYTKNGIASGTNGGSPAGKYDAARGGATQAQAWEVQYHGAKVRGIQGWWGHCNGWCVASALFAEPSQGVTVNGINFGIADIKGLLTEVGMAASADFYGNRVDFAPDYDSPKFNDTVPDQYFLVLTTWIGRLKKAVLIDRYTGDQVWNQPLAGYKIEYPKKEDYLGPDPQQPNVYRIGLTSTIYWKSDEVQADIITPPFDMENPDRLTVDSRTLRAEIWLDGPVEFDENGKITKSGNVIVTRKGEFHFGGSWKTNDWADGWPDYMWVPHSVYRNNDPNEDYANPYVDIEWIKNHILAGRDDPSASPRPVEPAPIPSSTPSSTPRPNPTATSNPNPWPTSTSNPVPWPTFTTTSNPVPVPIPTSTIAPGPGPAPVPVPPLGPGNPNPPPPGGGGGGSSGGGRR